MKLFIFDLDNTIDANCMKGKPRQTVLELLRKIKRRPNWYLYVVTARRYKDCDFDCETLLKHNIPKEITDLILDINKGMDYEDWLFFPNHSNEPTELVEFHLFKYPTIKQAYDDFVNKNRKFLRGDKKYFDFGLLKCLQIDHIINMKKPLTDEDLYPNTFFFDDAESNKCAWYFYSKYCVPAMRNIHFIGGNDKCVFSNIKQDEIKEVMQNE